ncbi:MAG: hypothetical protein QXR45_06795 [Candidatus Bathyarchaeia archaeon]
MWGKTLKSISSKSAITKMQASVLAAIIVIAIIAGIAYYYLTLPSGAPPAPVVKVGLLWPITGSLALIGGRSNKCI